MQTVPYSASEPGEAGWFRDENLLPVETIVFRNKSVVLGTFRCPADSVWFRDSGPPANHVFVFPRTPVGIKMGERREFVGGPNVVAFYNRGQEYRRFAATAGGGDHADWIALSPYLLLDIIGRIDPSVYDRPEKPFASDFVPSPARSCAAQRSLYQMVMQDGADEFFVEETAVHLLSDVLQGADLPKASPQRKVQERVEQAKILLGEDLSARLSIADVAKRTGTSVYYLCKVFRQTTGFSLYQFRQNLRLRQSLSRILDGEDLLTVAIDLGFYGHSHFTQAFRATFGMTPTDFRMAGRQHRAAAPIS